MVHAPARKKSLPANGEPLPEDNSGPIPPDGGWGWMVVFGSFMIHIITDGITYSFGLFFQEFTHEFQATDGYTAWIVSTMVGVTYASGPISSSFVNRFGCRAVTVAGAILASACIIVSMFAQNVLTLIITIGLGTGFGLGLIYLPAIVSVTQYFEAKRSLATGIAVCGSGLGTFIFSPITQILISELQWRYALLTLGGIVLICIGFGALFRPLKPTTDDNVRDVQIIKDNNELQPLKQTNYSQRQEGQVRSNSVGHAYEFNTNNNSNDYTNGKIPMLTVSTNEGVRSSVSQPHLAENNPAKMTELKANYGSGTMYRPDILYQGSLLNIPQYANSRHSLASNGGNRYGSLKRRNNLSESEDTVQCCGCVKCARETRDTFAEMMNFSLLRDCVFLIFTISNFCTSLGLNMPYIYLDKLSESLSLTQKESSYLLATIGIANTVGRIVLGYISDKSFINRQYVYNSCLTICGIATIMIVFCTDFFTLAIYCSVFGFTIGAYVGLTSVILVDLLGLDKLTNAFGLLLLFQGIASIIGAPIGGLLFDFTKSYYPAFYMAGGMILISGLIMFLIPPLQKRQEKACQSIS